MMQDLAFAIPGVDEALAFAELMKYAKSFAHANCRLTTKRQACELDAILYHRLRHCAHRSYIAILAVPFDIGKGSRQAVGPEWTLRTYDGTNVQHDGHGREHRGDFPGPFKQLEALQTYLYLTRCNRKWSRCEASSLKSTSSSRIQ